MVSATVAMSGASSAKWVALPSEERPTTFGPRIIRTSEASGGLPDPALAAFGASREDESQGSLWREMQRVFPHQARNALGSLGEYQTRQYVERRGLSEAWSSFLSSDKMTFAIIGSSGVGKSASMGYLAESMLGAGNNVLFFHGRLLGASVAQSFVDQLGERDGNVAASLDSVREYLSRTSHQVFLFIDALNEISEFEAISEELDQLTRTYHTSRPMSGVRGLRLVVSCTEADWARWSRIPGSRHMNSLAMSTYSHPQESQAVIKAIRLEEFDDVELADALAAYGVSPQLPPSWLELCRNAEVLTLVAQQAAAGNDELPREASVRALFADILEHQFPDYRERVSAHRLLLDLSSEMLSRGVDRVPLARVTERHWDLLARLASCGLLTSDMRQIRFQSDLVAELLIGEHIYDALFASVPNDSEAVERLAELTQRSFGLIPGAILEAFNRSSDEAQYQFTVRHHRLLSKLFDLSPTWTVVACLALGSYRGSPANIRDLLIKGSLSESYAVRATIGRILRDHPNWMSAVPIDDWKSREVRALASTPSGACDGSACKALWIIADDPHWRVRRAAGYGLSRNWDSCGEHDKTRVDLYSTDPARSWRQTHSLLIGMGGHPGRSVGETEQGYLRACAQSANRQVRWLVAYYLPRFFSQIREELIRILLADTDSWVRATLAQSIVKLALSPDGEVQAADVVHTLCEDPDPDVRIRLARALGRAERTPLTQSCLQVLVGDTSPAVVIAAESGEAAPGRGTVSGESRGSALEDPRRLIERIALQDIDVDGPEWGRIVPETNLREFSARRLFIEFVDDPYVNTFEAMKALLNWALPPYREIASEDEFRGLLQAIMTDPDEGLRWSFVMCLQDGNSPLTSSEVSFCLYTLSRDDHMWVQREVIIAVPQLVRIGLLNQASAERILCSLSESLPSLGLDAVQEIESFLRASKEQMELYA